MPQEDDLLACLLDVAEQELNSLKRQEKCNVQQIKHDGNIAQKNKNSKIYKDCDLFSTDRNQVEYNLETKKEGNLSSIHGGDTDSSDDECSRNFEEQKYNESGKAIKGLLQHAGSSYDRGMATHSKSSLSSGWLSKPRQIQNQALTKNTPSLKQTSNLVSTDTMFGIRVINPAISSKTLEDKMVGRKVVPISNINNYLRTLSKNDDWVIAGVICNKGTTRTSAKGNQFMIWNITDLVGDIKTVALFLFGSAYEQYWKTQVGSVVGVLNPSILDKKSGSKDEATLSVDNSQKLLILGQSKDLGTCKSTKKNGDKCTAIVNKKDCEYCMYHIKKEYQNCSRRSELQSNFSGKGLIALRNKVLGKNEVFYAGKSYTAIPAKQSKKMIKKDKDRLQSLNGISTTSSNIKKPVVKKSAASFDVNRGQRIKDLEILRKLGGNTEHNETHNSTFQNNHSSEVTMDEAKANALKILSKISLSKEDKSPKNRIEKENEDFGPGLKNGGSSTPTEGKTKEGKFEKSSKIELLQKSLDEMIQTDFIDLNLDYKSKQESTRSSFINSVDRTHEILPVVEKNESQMKVIRNKSTDVLSSSTNTVSTTESSRKKQYSTNEIKSSNSSQKDISESLSNQPKSGPTFSKLILGSSVPSLSNCEGVVDLSRPILKKANKAKMNALKYVEKHGPLDKSDPNKVRGKGLKRNLDDLDSSSANSQKLLKIQENEFLSDRFKKMMEVQSKHMDLVELRDNEEKEKYFKKQEVRERLEEKMCNTYKVECKAVRCLDCKYTNFSAAERCKLEKHRLVYKDATKRFFKCGNCGNRVACLDIIPIHACKNCGDARWERTTMMKEKNVTNTVNLSIRGGEQKFVNSVVSDANLNLMVPDDMGNN